MLVPQIFVSFLPMTVKEQILQAIYRLPDDLDYKDVAEEIAFLNALHEAEQDIEAGRVISDEQMRQRISGWTGG